MKQLTDDIWQLGSFPPDSINAFLVGDVLIDAKTRLDGKRIVKALQGRDVKAHALTHAHPDHQGGSHHVCTELGIPYWVPENDADAAENPKLIAERQPSNPVAQFFVKTMTGPAHPVDRRLVEGDEVAGFTVHDAPGHSAGHVVYWREADRTLIVGDVLNNMDVITTIRGLRLPKDFLTPDPARNRESARSLARFGEPSLVLFGHGPPLRDGPKFRKFLESL